MVGGRWNLEVEVHGGVQRSEVQVSGGIRRWRSEEIGRGGSRLLKTK